MRMSRALFVFASSSACASLPLVLLSSCGRSEDVSMPHVAAKDPTAAGRYIVLTAGCNDCHTAGWSRGKEIPESEWLTGDRVGFRGPWGTSYASNLRLTIKPYSEDSFIKAMKTRVGRPPMPWSALHEMSPADLAALYTYIRSLGPAGEPAPPAVPPNEEPPTRYIDMTEKISTRATPPPEPPATFPATR